ncbi:MULTISPECIES: tetraacyldisaccharide 4'-kinase [unclassified Tenacibaculum]|uniref:tetraacyldisaccharide 4'-kinase n=1 Tax=unclassified Tenacibaculum TaxID=2635139 RepID=UPI001F459CCE|nr:MULTISPECIES: tetraacyldisaccharide 4'-kinase [unclassified Tenacibaculum]MCF2876268.1 tetraacyldisaccharide 4'-kinase [Tenacibaculum sp. Cn5-1]MCF2936343.1 tetraacyldisaccharide 4'-kinase [Tenacibaculum sp. Cn5-34]MCG7511686.1 tetraacyldisaccharide 4'-kinase [Tenacibaculum sp. Cn5-46]
MKLLRFLLFPFAILYDIITSIRNWFFDIGILKSTSFNIPVIAVGNLSVGGTGKSPQIEYLIRLLKNDFKIATLSRGYKRKTKGFQILKTNHTATDVGDEPLQFFKKFGKEIIVAVDADRTNGIQQLLKNDTPPEIVLLDDAYQHRKVKASTYVLLTKYSDLFVDDFILPTGNLRESRRGSKRAQAIVVTKCPENLSKDGQNKIKQRIKLRENQQLFFTSISYDEELKGKGIELTISDLKSKEVLLVTGIANPTSLLSYLSAEGINYKHLKYPDHYEFTENDILKIEKEFKGVNSNDKVLLTTEKDYMRLENKLEDVSYISIKSGFIPRNEEFNKFILNEIKKTKL